jgi:menaquinone-dependent protoporphyrinogen oxidase
MSTIGILYSTVDGQTKKICEALANDLTHKNFDVSLYSINNFHRNILSFEILIIGASIRYGKHNDLVTRFINENRENLKKIKTAFFSVNLVARKKGKDRPATNPYLIKFMRSIDWEPDIIDVFAGNLDYSRYGLFDRIMIKAIMKFTNGPTRTPYPLEYTNWERVRLFGEEISLLTSKDHPEFELP